MRGNCTPPWFFLEPREQIELIAGHGGSSRRRWLHAEVDVAYHHGREFVEAQMADC
jgi:hypothetical protein